jgi:acetyltransferase-like isoleucine patch superfamily enzyme
MRKITLIEKIDFLLFGWIINFFYPEYYRPKYGYQKYYKLFFHYLIPQKLFRLNPNVNWPVHFTSKVLSPEKIKKGIICDPGDNPGIYIQANNGIIIGSNVGFGSGTKIISSIHSHDNHSEHDEASPIIIGNNVFVGANSVILPSVKIGDNVVIGAGSIVVKDIPSNSIAVGNPCKIIKIKNEYIEDFSKISFNKKIPEIYADFLK